MKTQRVVGLLSVSFVAVLLFGAQALCGESMDRGFTLKSLKGTYYIPCAEEGNYKHGSIHVAGMGKAEFDGKGNVTITQENVYTEIGGVVTRIVMDGYMVGSDQPAKFSGSYTVDREGFGQIYGGMFPDKDALLTPTFVVSETDGYGRAKTVYMIIPQNFVAPGDPPMTLIHVTARLR